MKGLNEIMKDVMNKVMLSCDDATLLLTRREFEPLGTVKSLQLWMHLFTCKLCRNFQTQTEFITDQLRIMSYIDEQNLSRHLTDEQKRRISERIQNQIDNN